MYILLASTRSTSTVTSRLSEVIGTRPSRTRENSDNSEVPVSLLINKRETRKNVNHPLANSDDPEARFTGTQISASRLYLCTLQYVALQRQGRGQGTSRQVELMALLLTIAIARATNGALLTQHTAADDTVRTQHTHTVSWRWHAHSCSSME